MQARHHLQDRHIPHAVMAGPVRPSDASPVEHEGDAASVQGHIHEDLVECAVEKCGIDRYHRVQATHGKTSCRRDGVLLGNPDVEAAIRECLGKSVQARRIDHRGRNGDDSFVRTTQPEQLFGEQFGPHRVC
jgi:hypothetical protein